MQKQITIYLTPDKRSCRVITPTEKFQGSATALAKDLEPKNYGIKVQNLN